MKKSHRIRARTFELLIVQSLETRLDSSQIQRNPKWILSLEPGARLRGLRLAAKRSRITHSRPASPRETLSLSLSLSRGCFVSIGDARTAGVLSKGRRRHRRRRRRALENRRVLSRRHCGAPRGRRLDGGLPRGDAPHERAAARAVALFQRPQLLQKRETRAARSSSRRERNLKL